MTYLRQIDYHPTRLPERLRDYIVVKPGPLVTPCWIWVGRTNRNGYGRCRWNGKEPVVHRVTFELLRYRIPEGRILDHECKTHCCVNPWHTEPVTHRENTLRGNAVLFKPRALT